MIRRTWEQALIAPLAFIAIITPISFGLPQGARTIWFNLTVVTLVAHVVTGRIVVDRRVAFWGLLGVLAALSAVLTADAAVFPTGHRRAAMGIVLLWVLAPPVVARLVSCASDLRLIVLAFVSGQTVSAAVGAIGVLIGNPTLGATAEVDRAYGLAGHPNVLALGGAAVVLWAVDRLQRQPSVLVIGVAALNLAAVVWSGSMSIALALVLALLVHLLVRRPPRRAIVATTATGAVIVLVASAVAALFGTRTPFSRVQQAVGRAAEESSLSERWRTWGVAIRAIADRPLHGVGLDEASGRTDVNDLVVHQVVLRGWYQGGPLLGLAMAAIVVTAVVLVVRSITRRPASVAPAILTVYLLFAMTSATLQQPYMWLVVITAWFATSQALDPDRRCVTVGQSVATWRAASAARSPRRASPSGV